MKSFVLRTPLISLAPLLFAMLFVAGCGSSGGTPERKKAGNSCVINRVACASMPARVCAAGKGFYRPYTCPSVGFSVGPCSEDAYGPIYAKSQVICNRIRATRQ